MKIRLAGRSTLLPSLPDSIRRPPEDRAAEPSVANTSNIPVYFRRKPTLVRAYRSMGDRLSSELSYAKDATKARAPW